MDNRGRRKNKAISCLEEQTNNTITTIISKQSDDSINNNDINSSKANINKHFTITSSSPSTSSSPKLKSSRKTTPINSARQTIDTTSNSSSSLSPNQVINVIDKANQKNDNNKNYQTEATLSSSQNTNNATKVNNNNNNSFSSTDSGRSSISSSQTSNGDDVTENNFNKTKVAPLKVIKVDDKSDTHKLDKSGNSNNINNNDNDNNSDGSPPSSAELDIYSDVTLIPKSTLTMKYTIKSSEKCTKRVNGRKPVKGIKTTTRQNVSRIKPTELKLHDELHSECEMGTSSNSYSLVAPKVNHKHNPEHVCPQTFKQKSINNQSSFQDCSHSTENTKSNISPVESSQDSQQSTTPDLSSFPSLCSSSPSSTSPCSISRSNHISDKIIKDNSSLSDEIQIRTTNNANQRRKELFTHMSSNNISGREGDCYELRNSSPDIKNTEFNMLTISINPSNDINELNRETKSEVSSPISFTNKTEIARSNSISDIFDSSTPVTTNSVTTSLVLVNENEPLRAETSSKINLCPRQKSNYSTKDPDQLNNHHALITNRRKSRYNSINNNNQDYSNLKSLLSNKYMKSFLMQPFLMPDYMNASAYTTVNGYDLAHLRKSFFNTEGSKQNFQTAAAAAAAAAALLPEPSLFINSPCYYWLPSSGFNNSTKNTNTTFTTDCVKFYNDKITNSSANNNSMNYVNGGNRYMLQQSTNQMNHGISESKSCEASLAPKVNASNDELNHMKRDSRQLNNHGHTDKLNKITSNSISRSMTKLNSLTPEDITNCDNFGNRPSSAKDLILTDLQSKPLKDNLNTTSTSTKGSNNCNGKPVNSHSTTDYLNSDNNSDKLGSIKYAPNESATDMMFMNITNSLGQPITVITNPIQIDTSQISSEDIMNIDRSGAVASATAVAAASATSATGLPTNYIPNPDSYITTPTTYFYFYNNEGQLFALPSNALIFPTAVGRLGTTQAVSNEAAYSSPATFIAPQVNGNNSTNNNCCNTSLTLRTTSCASNYDVPQQLYSGANYSTVLKNTDSSQCRELISGYSVPIQPSFLNGFHQWVPGQLTLDNGVQQLQNSSTNPLVIPSNQGVILHPSCPFPLSSVGLIQPLLSNVYPNQTFNSTSNSDDNSNRTSLSKQKNNQSNICSLMTRSTDQFKLRRFTNDLPSLLGNAKSTRSGTSSGKLINSNNNSNHAKYSGKGLMSTFLDDYNNTLNNQNGASRQKKHASKTNLYIRGLPTSFTEEELHTLAPDRKLIRSVKLIAGAEGEMYGFIDFVNNEAAKSALLHIKSGNRELYVNFAYESEKDPQNVYITNIPESWTASNVEDLKQIFQPYGPISTAIVMTKRSNNFCTGAGFVRFVRPEDAQRAIDGIRNAQITLENGKGPLEVKLADRQKPSDDQSNTTKVRSLKRNSEPPDSSTSTGLMNGNEENVRHSRTRKQSDCLLPNDSQLSNHNTISSNQLRSNPGVLGPATDLTSWDVTNRLSNSDSFILALRAAWASNSLQNSSFLLRNSIGQNNLTTTSENNRGLLPIPNQNLHLTNLMPQQKVPNGILHSQNPVQHSLVTGPNAAAAAAAAVTALLPFSRPIDSYSLSQALMHTPVAPTMIGPMIQPASSWTASPLIPNIYQSI